MTWDRTPLEDVAAAGYTRLIVVCCHCGHRGTVEIAALKHPGWLPLDRLPFRCGCGQEPKGKRWQPRVTVWPDPASQPWVGSRHRAMPQPLPDGTTMRPILAPLSRVRAEIPGDIDVTADPMPWLGWRGSWERRQPGWLAEQQRRGILPTHGSGPEAEDEGRG